MNRNEERLPNLKCACAVDDGARLGPGDYVPRHGCAFHDPIIDMKANVKVAHNLQRIHPGLEPAILISQQRRARADGRNESAGTHRVRDLRQVSGILCRQGQSAEKHRDKEKGRPEFAEFSQQPGREVPA